MTIAKKHKAKFGANTQLITLSAVFAALTYAMTAFIHIPTAKGYIHIGDAVVFMAASLLPKPYAMAAAAIGASFSDMLSGYWIWVPATFIIKAVTVLAFTSKKSRILCKRNFTALVPALVLCVGGRRLCGRTGKSLSDCRKRSSIYCAERNAGQIRDKKENTLTFGGALFPAFFSPQTDCGEKFFAGT